MADPKTARFGHFLRLLLLVSLSACKVYTTNLFNNTANTPPTPGKDAGTDASIKPKTDASPGTDACRSTAEICNGVDDDCNGIVDDGPSIQAYCEVRVLHTQTGCYNGVCVQLTIKCDPGYANCDGQPSNGCEAPYCSCNICLSDAGVSDGGGSDAH